MNTLTTSDWVRKGLPLCWSATPGAAKSHLLVALGTEAALASFRVEYTFATRRP